MTKPLLMVIVDCHGQMIITVRSKIVTPCFRIINHQNDIFMKHRELII